jgi:protein TonB
VRHYQGFIRDEAEAACAVSRHWIVCVGLAVGIHALLLFAIHPGTVVQPRALVDGSSAVEVSIVEAAAGEPLSTPIVPPAAPEVRPEPAPEPVAMPVLEPEKLNFTPAPSPRTDTAKALSVSSPRRASTRPAPASNGSTHGANAKSLGRGGPNTSVRPRYRSNPKPGYPPEARRAGQQGVVILAVQVTVGGRPANVEVSRSSGFPLLDAAALQAVRRWTFEPARTLGIPVAARVEIPVRFDLKQN